MWRAVIHVGLFGRIVKTPLRRWRWLTRIDADLYCICEMRVTFYSLERV